MYGMRYAAISLNLDSLGWMCGFPGGYRDPSFFQIADRFFDISWYYNFKYSIYVIGKDLEKEENRARVREWSREGHEIGNHSWSHRIDIGATSYQCMYDEIKRAHDIISETVGYQPKGFIAPAWNTSSALRKVLVECGYTYDTSSFPSWLMFPAILKNLYNHRGSRRFFEILKREDWFTLIGGRREAHQNEGLFVLPMPTNRLRIACWHTLGFMVGWELHERILRACLREIDAFYYLVHPADLLDQNDLDSSRQHSFERMHESLEKKTVYLRRVIETILESGRVMVTMEELIKKIRP